eukprot:9938289-Prorocentrum_lima.AAC.1
MTSSLVGSEMCIRDRESGIRLGTPTQLGTSALARVEGSAVRPRATGSVSYTHLTLPTICSV